MLCTGSKDKLVELKEMTENSAGEAVGAVETDPMSTITDEDILDKLSDSRSDTNRI